MQTSLSSKQDLTRKFFFFCNEFQPWRSSHTQDYNKSTFSIYPTTWRCSLLHGGLGH
jgi:hypothetical protein